MNITTEFLHSKHTAVVRFGVDADAPSRHITTVVHSGNVISPDLDRVRNEWNGFRSEGNVIMGGYYRLNEPVPLELPDNPSGVGRALIVGERIGRFVAVSYVHTDNRRETRIGAINKVSFVARQRDSVGEDLAENMMRALQREGTYDDLRDFLGEEYVPLNLKVAAVALYGDGSYKVHRQFD